MGKLRMLLAISVIATHTTPIFGTSLIGGAHAVHAFYIISGFYMSMILNEKYTGKNSFQMFITNRFLRLYPVYWVVLFLSVMFSCFVYIHNKGVNNALLTSYVNYFFILKLPWKLFLIIVNLFVFGQDIVMFMGFNSNTGNLVLTKNFHASNPQVYTFLFVPQAWTLALELTFYLIAPFLLRKSLKFICLLIMVAFSLRLLSVHYGYDYDPWNNRFFVFEIGFFLAGNIAYRIYCWLRTKDFKRMYYHLTLVCIGLVIILFYHLPFKTPLLYACIFISIPILFIGSKGDRWDRVLGELSYPIYISHFLLLQLTEYLGLPISGILLTAESIFFSILLNEFISKKIEIIRQKRLRGYAV